MKSLLTAITILFSASFSQAFTLNSSTDPNLQGWADTDVLLLVNTTNCPAGVDVPGIVSAAAEIWNNVPTSKVKVIYGGTTTSTTYSSPATIYCETNYTNIGMSAVDQDSIPGAAAVIGSTGRITQGLMFLNATSGRANIARFDQTLLKIILAHEIGHLLGLGHSHSTNALMYYDGSAKKNFSLSQDDIDGISYLYPSDELGDSKKMAGCGLIKNPIPPTRGGLGGLLFLFALPLLVYWGLRSRASQLARPV